MCETFLLFIQITLFLSLSVGHVLTSVNGVAVNGSTLEDGRNVKDVFENASEFPLTLKFARPKMTTNEKIFLASMFYPLFAIASQLSPEPKSSGIEVLEADTFKLQCFQTLTGKQSIPWKITNCCSNFIYALDSIELPQFYFSNKTIFFFSKV